MRNAKGHEDYSQMGKDLKGKAKWSNFWYYYKWQTVAAICIAVVAVFTIYEIATRVDPDLMIDIVTEGVITSGEVDYNARFGDLITDIDGDDIKSIQVSEIWVPENPQDEQSLAMQQKVDLEFAAGDVTLFLFDETNYNRYENRDAFEPMDRFLDPAAVPEEKKVYDEEGKWMAVKLNGSAALQELGFQTDDLYASFIFLRDEDADDPEVMARFENGKAVLEELLK